MTMFKHMTITALVTFFSLAAFGCDSVSMVMPPSGSQAPSFSTVSEAQPVTESLVAEPGEEQDVTLQDIAHTATTVGEMTPVETTEEAPVSEPVVGEPTVEETVVVEEPVEEPAEEAVLEPVVEPVSEIFSEGSEPVAWSPNGTYKLPSYGAGCRFTTDNVVQLPSNGATDDTLLFAATAGPNATFEVVVETPSGLSVVADVDMKRGLTGRSYRQASGDAVWSTKDGEFEGSVVDGTLCFDEKLDNGMGDVLAEFSLVVELDGVYYAMGGNVLIEGTQVSVADGFAIDGATAVDIDLR